MKYKHSDGLCNAEGNQPCNLKQNLSSLWRRLTQWVRSLFTRRATLFVLAGWLAMDAFMASASAQSKEPLAIALTSQRVVFADGKEKAKAVETLAPADKALPGDVIQFVAVYRNVSDQLLRDLEPILPIPAGMSYLAESARPSPAFASLDGKLFQAIPLKRLKKLADGSMREELVSGSEYRSLRWAPLDLTSGQYTNITARAVVTTNSTPSASEK